MVKIRVSSEDPKELDQVLSILKSSGNKPDKIKIPAQEEAKHRRAYLDLKLVKGIPTENYSLELVKTCGSNEVQYFRKLHSFGHGHAHERTQQNLTLLVNVSIRAAGAC